MGAANREFSARFARHFPALAFMRECFATRGNVQIERIGFRFRAARTFDLGQRTILMKKIPQEALDSLNESLLGRLRLKLCEEIVGAPGTAPTPEETVRYILDQYRANSYLAHMYSALLTIEPCYQLEYEEITQEFNVDELIRELQANPLDKDTFLEIQGCPAPYPQTVGVLVHRTKLKDGAFVYDVTIQGEEKFPKFLLGVAMCEIGNDRAKIIFSAIDGHGKWIKYSFEDWRQSFCMSMCL